MPKFHRLLCIFAHPDDESFATGGILARCAAQGVATYLLTATRGEQGWAGPPPAAPAAGVIGRIREGELRAAAAQLGLQGLKCLAYPDGALAEVERGAVLEQLTRYIRQMRPQVVVTFGPDGLTGHPDHLAICQLATTATMCATDPGYAGASDWQPHQVTKLYYLADTRTRLDAFEAVFGESAMTVKGVTRRVPGWPEWAITTRIDAGSHWRQIWQAIACHRSQLPDYEALAGLTEAQHRELWGTQELYRVFSLVDVASGLEDNLFAGIP